MQTQVELGYMRRIAGEREGHRAKESEASLFPRGFAFEKQRQAKVFIPSQAEPVLYSFAVVSRLALQASLQNVVDAARILGYLRSLHSIAMSNGSNGGIDCNPPLPHAMCDAWP